MLTPECPWHICLLACAAARRDRASPSALGEAAAGAGGAEEELAHLPRELLAPVTQPSLGIAPWGQR